MTEIDTMIHVIVSQSERTDREAEVRLDDQIEMGEMTESSIEETATTGGLLIESTTLTLAQQALRNLGYGPWTRIVVQVLPISGIFPGHP
jgi:hypothetical protein